MYILCSNTAPSVSACAGGCPGFARPGGTLPRGSPGLGLSCSLLSASSTTQHPANNDGEHDRTRGRHDTRTRRRRGRSSWLCGPVPFHTRALIGWPNQLPACLSACPVQSSRHLQRRLSGGQDCKQQHSTWPISAFLGPEAEHTCYVVNTITTQQHSDPPAPSTKPVAR